MSDCMKSMGWVVTTGCFIGGLLSVSPDATAHIAQANVAQTVAFGTDAYKRSMKNYLVPDVVLTDFDDRPVRLRELLATNDPVMVDFVFTTCRTICPVTTKVLSEMPSKLGSEGKRLRLISISIDPENDTPLQLKAYARSYQAGERWKFLTGRAIDVKSVQMAFDTYRGDKMSHEPVTLMRQSSGKPWVRIDGFATPEELVREYRKVAQQ